MVFSVDGFIGASPELLIARAGDQVTSHPLAGTVARSGDAHADEALVAGLMASPKARSEHQVVVDALRAALTPVCADLDVPDRRRRSSACATCRISPPASRPGCTRDTPLTALELVARVHPTPAVGGNPTDAAARAICRRSRASTGAATPARWAGSTPGGTGPGRSGSAAPRSPGPGPSIFAGNGVVAGSDPADELAETQLKLQALLAALVRP